MRDLSSIMVGISRMIPKGRKLRIMEVCGTHTVEISRLGIRNLFEDKIDLISGPGCPVCVTSENDFYDIIKIAQQPDVIIATFGDMMRVPINSKSLLSLRATGCNINMISSPEESIDLALNNPDKKVVLIGVGFETTIPGIAATIIEADTKNITNLYLYESLKTVPNALRALLNIPTFQVDALMLPGHVSAIIGEDPYQFLADEYQIPSVITGFNHYEILDAIERLVTMIMMSDYNVDNAYRSVVKEEGNPLAIKAINTVFEECNAEFRGLGTIEDAGLMLNDTYRSFSSNNIYTSTVRDIEKVEDCICGSIIIGAAKPFECPQFGITCLPNNPLGPCMVSSEGACAAYFKYR